MGFSISAGTTAALGIGAAATAGAGYEINKSMQQKPIAPRPVQKPTAETAPPTMTDAINTTQQKAKPTKQTSGGTVGDLGPEGLTTPPQTANLTLLGGTK